MSLLNLGILSQINDYNNIGVAGTLGFGVGSLPSTRLPSGFSALPGSNNKASDNYGNYQYQDGSIMVWIPKFYYKIGTGSNGLAVNIIDIKGVHDFTSRVAAEAQGYALHRVFIDGGVIKNGFFVDKYKCSKTTWGVGQIASSIKNGLPISTAADHNPIADLTACSSNNYYQAINAAHARDGIDGAINPISNFFVTSRFIKSAIAMLSMAHGQAAINVTNCAWYLVNKNYPKGCNNNSLHDIDDNTVSYVSDGYSNCGKTGSGLPFAKTTHNGQNSGVADLNGLMWEINLGITRDSGNLNFYVLKESIAFKNLTAGVGGTNDAWGDSTHLADLYDIITIPCITGNDAWIRFGNATNQVLSETISGDNWKLTGMGIPKDLNGLSTGGTNLFGVDGLYRYLRADLCLISSASWLDGSLAGVWGVHWSDSRASAYSDVGLRCACMLP